MSPFEYIPDEFKPTADKHVEYSEVYRALHGYNVTKEDFYPTIIERNSKKKGKLFEPREQGDYSVSVFRTMKAIKLLFDSSMGFRNSHKAIAKGCTTKRRGYSYEADKKGHIDYFLYDYLENNPYEDFKYCEELCDL